ncbi:MAG: PQQ-binding-like beta-propeller repeat protein [Balneolaceae bacterium]
MTLLKLGIYVILISSLLSSCGLFGGGDDDIKGGEVVWSVKNQEILTVSTKPTIDEDHVYFIQDAKLKSYTLKKGEHRWSVRICQQGRTCDYSRTIVQTEDLLFIDQGFTIQAHAKSDGRIIWETNITDDAVEVSGIGSPIMSQDQTYLYAGRKGYVLKVQKSNGEIIHRYELDRMVPDGVIQGSTEPIISPFGDDILYVPGSYFDHSQPTPEKASGGNIFAFNALNGALIWEREIIVTIPNPYPDIPGDSLTGSPMIYDISVTEDEVIVLAGFSIVALDRMTGDPVWKTYFSKGGFDVGLAVKDNGVYAASIGSFATRLDLLTGNVLWQRDIKFSNTSIPTIQDGRMYFNNSGGGGIWVLDTEDGSVIYNEPPPNHSNDSFDVYISSLGVGEGYMVNVGSKAVYCLTVP